MNKKQLKKVFRKKYQYVNILNYILMLIGRILGVIGILAIIPFWILDYIVKFPVEFFKTVSFCIIGVQVSSLIFLFISDIIFDRDFKKFLKNYQLNSK